MTSASVLDRVRILLSVRTQLLLGMLIGAVVTVLPLQKYDFCITHKSRLRVAHQWIEPISGSNETTTRRDLLPLTQTLPPLPQNWNQDTIVKLQNNVFGILQFNKSVQRDSCAIK